MSLGCTALPGGAHLDRTSEPRTDALVFNGLADGVRTGATSYVFIVHGMGATTPDYAEPLEKGFAKFGLTQSALDSTPTFAVKLPETWRISGEGLRCKSPTEAPCKLDSFGAVTIKRFASNGRKVALYEYFWNKEALKFQSPYVETDKTLRPRAAINNGLKNDVIIDGFSDATLYAGGFGAVMVRGTEGALCMMLQEIATNRVWTSDDAPCKLDDVPLAQLKTSNAAISLLSFSLGSRLLFDTLSPAQQPDLMAAESETAVLAKTFALARTREVYLLANQWPLLGISRLQARRAGAISAEGPLPGKVQNACGDDVSAFAFIRCVRGAPPISADDDPVKPPLAAEVSALQALGPLKVIAFRDPNDLLGFRAGDHLDTRNAQSSGLDIIEVTNRNATEYLWLFANPKAAHANEHKHSRSLRLIMCGARSRPSGELEPRPCGK